MEIGFLLLVELPNEREKSGRHPVRVSLPKSTSEERDFAFLFVGVAVGRWKDEMDCHWQHLDGDCFSDYCFLIDDEVGMKKREKSFLVLVVQERL